jgi:hypothetical protein
VQPAQEDSSIAQFFKERWYSVEGNLLLSDVADATAKRDAVMDQIHQQWDFCQQSPAVLEFTDCTSEQTALVKSNPDHAPFDPSWTTCAAPQDDSTPVPGEKRSASQTSHMSPDSPVSKKLDAKFTDETDEIQQPKKKMKVRSRAFKLALCGLFGLNTAVECAQLLDLMWIVY